jgi:hypothetical protein
LERTYRGNGRLSVKLLLSNYSAQSLEGELVWKMEAGDQMVAKQQTSLKVVPQGEVAETAHVDVGLPEVASPTKLRITAEIVADGKRFSNDWSSWLYPSAIAPAASSTPAFVDEPQIAQWKAWAVKPIPAKGDLDGHAVYVVRWPCDPRVVNAMIRGASVVILDGTDQLLKSHTLTFRPTWWKAGGSPETNHTGTFVYDHPATRAMAPDGWCDDAWFHLIEGGKKCMLESAPTRPEVIIRALPSMELIEDDALLFEVGVGKGSLIVSGLNHRGAAGRPENEWLVARLIDHAATFSRPKAKWPELFFLPRSSP